MPKKFWVIEKRHSFNFPFVMATPASCFYLFKISCLQLKELFAKSMSIYRNIINTILGATPVYRVRSSNCHLRLWSVQTRIELEGPTD